MTYCPSSVTIYLQHMLLPSRTSPKATVAARTPPWPVAPLSPATGSPQEVVGGPTCPF
jgi:hypothetical protein